MAKSNGGDGKAQVRDVLSVYSTPGQGRTLAEIFSVAHGAIALGHRTFANVPFDRPFKSGDQMTAGQAAFLSAAVVRASLGNEDYDTINEAAAAPVREIPAQYSLLEDAVDALIVRLREKSGVSVERRVDREGQVAEIMNSAEYAPKVSGPVAAEIKRLISERKQVKGRASEAAKSAKVGDLLAGLSG